MGAHADEYRALVRELVDGALDEQAARGSVEVVVALAAPLPCRITARMIGFAEADWPKVKSWSERQMRLDTRDVDPAIGDEFMGSIVEWMLEMQQIIPQRTEAPTGDFISRWLFPPDGQPPLAGDDMVMEAGLLIAGGAETTRTLISHGLRAFCDHPDQWELLHAEPERIPAAVEELLRWVSPLNNMFRTAVRDTELHGQAVHDGERLALLYPAANRDPDTFERPQDFDIARDPTPTWPSGSAPTSASAPTSPGSRCACCSRSWSRGSPPCERPASPTWSRTCSPAPSGASSSGSTSGEHRPLQAPRPPTEVG